MQFIHDDGGRAAAGWKGEAGDCVVRAIAIATGKPYQEVYDALSAKMKTRRLTKLRRYKGSARDGVNRGVYERYLESIGWKWTPTMHIGSGCKVHLADGELPPGRLIVRLSRHLTAVVDGVIRDTYDPQRSSLITEGGVTRVAQRCVYGYYTQGV